MSTGTTSNGDDRLQRYFDEELSSEEMDVLRAELDGDDDLKAKLDGLAYMRGLMVEGMQDVGADLDADAMFSAIESRLSDVEDDDPMFPEPVLEPVEETEEARPQLRVVPGGKPADEVPAEVVQPEAPSRTGVWIGAAAVLAAAAAVMFFLLRPPNSVDDNGSSDPPLAAAPAGSEIEDVDFGYSTGSIFTVEDPDADAQYAVIWISDEKVDDGTEETTPPEDPDAVDPDAVDPDAQDAPAPEQPNVPDAPDIQQDEGGESPE